MELKNITLNEANHIKVEYPIEVMLEHSSKLGNNSYAIFLNGTSSLHYTQNPYAIKKGIISQVSKLNSVQEIKQLRNREFLVKTNDKNVAYELLKIDSILFKNGKPALDKESVQSSFLIHNVDPALPLLEVLEDLESQNILATELYRFSRFIDNKSVPSRTIKVVQLGTKILEKIKNLLRK